MTTPRLARLMRAVSAVKRAEMGRLGALIAEIARNRQEVDGLRRALWQAAPAQTVDQMRATASWQARLKRRIADAESEAARLEAEAEAQRQVLAKALGREIGVERLQDSAARAARREAARRQDDTPPSSSSRPSAGSPGIA
ncbi:MAG: hypothetical protein AAF713_19660 [Pseudomonadota bacterium]